MMEIDEFVLDLIKDAKNSYVLFDVRNNTYAILPKEMLLSGVKKERQPIQG